jgi:hypothetical protein
MSFDLSSYNDTEAFLASSSMKEIARSDPVNKFSSLLRTLGIETVVLWNAVFLKKRVLVVSDNLPRLLSIIRTLPQLAWHR